MKRKAEGEPCSHTIVHMGLCAICGAHVGQVAGLKTFNGREGVQLALSADESNHIDTMVTSRLLASRKLSLVLDLDHTLVHATAQPILLRDGEDATLTPMGAHLYQIKARPYVREFLTRASKLFELSVDTAGTRPYAVAVVRFLDPEGTLFGERIVSRTDSSLQHKQTQWLHNTKGAMALVVDDTEKAWPGARNLLLMEPYMFYSHAPDVNNAAGAAVGQEGAKPAGAPPKPRREAPTLRPPVTVAAPTAAAPPTATAPPPAATPAPPPVAVSGGGAGAEAIVLPTVELLHGGGQVSAPMEEAKPYLPDMLNVLAEVHGKFYSLPDSSREALGVDGVLAEHFRTILEGVVIVFSGVFPLATKHPERSLLWRRAVMMGATIQPAVRPGVTHVVAARPGTAKVKLGASTPGVAVVHSQWLQESLRRYARQPEPEFPLQGFEEHAVAPVEVVEDDAGSVDSLDGLLAAAVEPVSD